MIRIISLSNPRIAQAFVDYMATLGVQLQVKHDGQEVQLWLEDESQLEKVEPELNLFLKDPLHARYQAASWHTGSTQANLQYERYSYWQRIRSQAGPLTMTVMVICILVYILQQIYGDQTVMEWLAWPADRSQYSELWRWFTPAFLHFSILHILFNLMWWWYLGGPVEKRLGSGKLFTIALISALLSGWGQSLFSGIYFGGLSGVVYALMGYVWLTGELKPERQLSLPRGLMVFAIAWLALGYFNVMGLAIANAAHVFGLAVGLIMAFCDTRTPRKKSS
ncbi:rhomboid family intramembrane serine protease GlpG [Rouxiella badensis]|jgi:GlpG protein|uniref:rhomboid family intramembrane serine protease GlpG n=2 Tax=Rouxiella badensis TaxID=1646377 RepID=UPI00036BCFA2|nr:rhomboid family intramembrane serine protease GlpG [Rouxiella badensis]MCC3702756.1 rhomboid family intramembrane serine protease GlpG [Rouxiella badensis]MCC3720387.1 rhomboid family intramembrane serine protease GlpG [Rouxiella badensis]MCC3730225.1 rhomboid family intramembrane serine protease GlpG [Rouxiella badensis]MCC3734067.1 rhomboid family intramembrane serine protease GlpG [Rouxiella badensis]MCC3741669.1 rhomboid family intramembrane serine protease GlpG [Rouxiella badensis]